MHSQLLLPTVVLLLSLFMIGCAPRNESKDSMHVESGGVGARFELKSDAVWRVPERGQRTAVYLALEMTNLGKVPLRFPIRDKFQVSIQHPDGREERMEGGTDGIRPGKPATDPIPPGGKFVLRLPAHLIWGAGDHLQFSIQDDFGSIWWAGPLKAGSYLVKMNYERRATEKPGAADLWSGRAVIAPVGIRIVSP